MVMAKGDKGDRGVQGNQGNRGEQGQLSRPLRRALVYLFALAFLLALGALFVTFHDQGVTRAAQQRQGKLLERKLCTTFGRLAAEKPPPGNPQANPSRAYLQGQHAILAEVFPDLGCRR